MSPKVSLKQKRIARLARESYQLAFRQADQAAALLDDGLLILDVSDRFCAMLDRPRRQCLGQTIEEILASVSEDFIARLRQSCQQGTPAEFTTEVILQNGEQFALEAAVTPIETATAKRFLVSLRCLNPVRLSAPTPKSNFNEFRSRVNAIRQQAEAALSVIGIEPLPAAVVELFESLQVSLEELEVADAELHLQNSYLIESQAALQATKHRYQDLFEFMPEGYVVTDIKGTIKEANLAATLMLNVTRKHIIGYPIVTFVAEQERRLFRAKLEQHRKQGNLMEWELRLKRREQTDFPASLHLVASRILEGEPSVLLWFLRDLTESKQANRALRDSQNLLANVFGSAMDAIISVDDDQHILFFNPAAEKMFGCHADAAIGQPIERFIPERYRAAHKEHIFRFVQAQVTNRKMGALGILYGLRADGAEFPMEVSISQMEAGGKKFYTVILRDISERQRAEDALRLLSGSIEQSYDAIIIWEFNGAIIFWNQGAEMLYGYTKSETIGRTTSDLLQTVRPISTQTFIDELERKGYWEGELQHTTQSGKKVIVNSRLTLVHQPDGRVYVLETNRDITARKQYEEKLLEQATLLDQATDAVIVRDLEERILYWNKSAERIYGWTAEETIGRTVQDLHYKEIDRRFYEAKRILLESGRWAGEGSHLNKEGKQVFVETRWTLLRDDQSAPKSVLVINSDITEKKKLEAQFLRAQRMESIGTLAGGIAHDLNNILSPIMMALALFETRFTDTESQHVLTMLRASAMRGSGLINQVLAFARGVEGERILLQPKHIINEVKKMLSDTLPKTIDIRHTACDDLLPIIGDATQIHQVLTNLVINARDAMPQGGKIIIEAQNISIDDNYAQMNPEAKPGPYVCLTVSDTGAGIPEEIMSRIFDPFFTTKESGKGTGLGLATVMTIVKSHGGFLNVYSELGRGAEFRVYLPAAEVTLSGQSAASISELPRGNGELILVVDDEVAVREVTRSTLETYGYRVLLAADGAEAVALFAQHREEIGLVLTDTIMPYMDGPATIQAIRRLRPDIKVILSSGLQSEHKEEEAGRAGAQAFLAKPYTAETLLHTLAELLGSS
jgi:PAS domain S-box-containing protein